MQSRFQIPITLALVLLLVVGSGVLPAGNLLAKDKPKDDSKDKVYLGVYLSELDETHREALEIKGDNGILITDVAKDGPAAAAGIEGGDILVKLDGEKIKSLKSLRIVLAAKKPDDDVKAIVIRDGKEKKLKVKLGRKPAPAKAEMEGCSGPKRAFLGVEFQELGDQLAEYFKVKSGVLIKRVAEESPAETAGLKAGDVILKINDSEIASSDDLPKTMQSFKPGDEVTVFVSRAGDKKEFKAKLGEAPEKQSITWDLENLKCLKGLEGLKCLETLEDVDWEGIQIKVLKGLEDLEIDLDDDEELREEIEELRKEIEELRKEMKK